MRAINSVKGLSSRPKAVSSLGLAAICSGALSALAWAIPASAPLLVLAPAFGLVTSRRSALLLGTAIALATTGLLALINNWPHLDTGLLATGIIGSALIGLERQRHANLLRAQVAAEQERSKLYLAETTELITRHNRHGSTLYASSGANRVFGVDPDQLLQAGFCERIHLQDRVLFLKAVSDAAASGHETVCEVRIRSQRSKNLVWRDVEVLCRPTHDPDIDEPIVSAITRDRHDVRRLEKQITDLEEQLAAGRSREKHGLMRSLDLLNQPIADFVDQVDESKRKTSSKTDTARDAVFARLRTLAETVRDTLESVRVLGDLQTRSYQAKPTTFELPQLIDDVKDSLADQARARSVQIRSRLSANLPVVTGDRQAWFHLVHDLLSTELEQVAAKGVLNLKVLQHGRSIRIVVERSNTGTTGRSETRSDLDAMRLAIAEHFQKLQHADVKQKTVRNNHSVTLTLPTNWKPLSPKKEDTVASLNNAATVKRKQDETSKKGAQNARLSA